MTNLEYMKSISAEEMAQVIGSGIEYGKNKGCAECQCKVDESCNGCNVAWLNWLNAEHTK